MFQPNITPMKLDKDFNANGPFPLSWDEVSQLCLSVLTLVKSEAMILRLRAPIKGNEQKRKGLSFPFFFDDLQRTLLG